MLKSIFAKRRGAAALKPRGMSPIEPLNIRVSRELAAKPAVNLLLPWVWANMSGGPNTALNLACRVGARGIPLRLIGCDQRLPKDMPALERYIKTLTATHTLDGVELLSANDRGVPLTVGPNDLFIATYWMTAHYLKPVLPRMNRKEFVYLIQDYEPAFYPWSSNYAWVQETYRMEFRAVINEHFLADYLCERRIGRFADPSCIGRCAVFQPAVDERFFYPASRSSTRTTKRLLFYARPYAPRNLFELGHDALNLALRDSVFAAHNWEFHSIGGEGQVADLPLEGGRIMRALPWRDYENYAALLKESDLLLCLMLSPHTSYPVLEMAACGGLVVTNSFATKTAQGLQAISPNILAAEPSTEGVAAALVQAARRSGEGYDRGAAIGLPKSWDESLEGAVAMVTAMFHARAGG